MLKIKFNGFYWNIKLYVKGVILTLFYILLAPIGTSLISIGLAFISPLLSVLSFLLTLVFVSVIRMKRISKDSLENVDLTDDEKEFVDNIRKSIYGEWGCSFNIIVFNKNDMWKCIVFSVLFDNQWIILPVGKSVVNKLIFMDMMNL